MRGAGNGTFAPFVRLAVGGGSWGLTNLDHSRPYDFADIDGDGDIDLINSQGDGANIVIWLNDGSENFSVGTTIDPPGSRGGYALHVADFTGDGRLDIFTTSNFERVELFVRDATGLSFTQQLSADVFNLAGNLAGSDGPVDIDGDGDLDIILANNIEGQYLRHHKYSSMTARGASSEPTIRWQIFPDTSWHPQGRTGTSCEEQCLVTTTGMASSTFLI